MLKFGNGIETINGEVKFHNGWHYIYVLKWTTCMVNSVKVILLVLRSQATRKCMCFMSAGDIQCGNISNMIEEWEAIKERKSPPFLFWTWNSLSKCAEKQLRLYHFRHILNILANPFVIFRNVANTHTNNPEPSNIQDDKKNNTMDPDST